MSIGSFYAYNPYLLGRAEILAFFGLHFFQYSNLSLIHFISRITKSTMNLEGFRLFQNANQNFEGILP